VTRSSCYGRATVGDYTRELAVALEAARAAGAGVRRHYAAGSITVETKSDRSPVTAADREANDAIVAILRRSFPDDGVLTEESPDDGTRLQRSRVWIVDPLDGTRDFVARTDDFCVHVALAVDGVPTVGVVHQVVPRLTYAAILGQGAFVEDDGALTDGRPTRRRIGVSSTERADQARVGTSRLNVNAALRLALQVTGLAARAVTRGASVKLMAVARGELDAVINFSPAEMEWDTCAPEVIIREAGGKVTDLDGEPLQYNQTDLARRRGSVATNGACHEAVRDLIRPHFPEARLTRGETG
jgi:3'(2'), 5'-bisphosphate nucleotidase